ncbi:polysaccharide deacetylase family protein [Proteinivorax hydrogeniformans]|uniref:Polysaccharide deacetylase family protein n=1 Tax=Proteinivorax hydrogeniformans TaxID=1826727 RepID=A0AAU8HUW9_9FIRM
MERGGTKSFKVFVLANILLIGVLLSAVESSEMDSSSVNTQEEGKIMELIRFVTDDFFFADASVTDKNLLPYPQKPKKDAKQEEEEKNDVVDKEDGQEEEKEQEDKNEEQKPPEKPKEPRPTKRPVSRINTSQKKVALTFDDGPNAQTLTQMLDILAEYDVSATFFVIGSTAKANEHLLQQIVDDGHQVANHSYTHSRFSQLNYEQSRQEIIKTQNIIGNYSTGRYFRPPYGAYTDTTLEVAYSEGFEVVMWSVDTRDWETNDPDRILNTVKSNTQPGGIILFHEGHQVTLKALPDVLQWLISEGYQFVTIEQLFDL